MKSNSETAPAFPDPPSLVEVQAHQRAAAKLAGLSIPEFTAPIHRHTVVNALRLHSLDWGRANERPVLFLHGGGQTARTWDLACLALRDDFHCLALDQRGHGDSEWSYDFDYAPECHARDFEGFLDAEGIDRVAVVGMSMGCLNGLHFALRHPERVSAFVAVDAGPWVQIEAGRHIADFMAQSDGARSLEVLVEHALRFNPRRDPRLLRVSLRHNLRRLPDGRLTWKADRRRPTDFDRMRRSLEALQERVAELRCPTLILRGAESRVFLDDHAERFARAAPNARWLRIEGAGHTIQGDAPAAMVRAIRSFLA
jgi:pimeloyl-ACP methyl ester carboxylesterase